MMKENVRDLNLTTRVKMVPMMILEHTSLSEDEGDVRYNASMPLRLMKIHIKTSMVILTLIEVVCMVTPYIVKDFRREEQSVQL